MARAKSPRRGKIEYELYIICSLSNPEPFKMDEMAGDKNLQNTYILNFHLCVILILLSFYLRYPLFTKFFSSNLDRIFIIAF